MEAVLCATCGKSHEGLALEFGPEAPDPWFNIPELDRFKRASLSRERCVLDSKHCFVRGCIDLPILGSEDFFTWLVWVSLSNANFERTSGLMETRGRESEPPYFGWLSTRLPGYPDTWLLKTNVYTNPVGVLPSVVLEPNGHPLAVEQQDGITRERARELVGRALHG